MASAKDDVLTIPVAEFDHLFAQYKRLRDENERLRAELAEAAAALERLRAILDSA
jgi:cell shape-determining protein MreC